MARLRTPSVDVRPTSQGRPDPEALVAAPHSYSLHAQTRVDAGHPERLEALVRYVARPALARGRLEIRRDGKISDVLVFTAIGFRFEALARWDPRGFPLPLPSGTGPSRPAAPAHRRRSRLR